MKELYFFDQLYYNALLGLHKRLLTPMNELSVFYNRMGLKEPFSDKILTEAINDTVHFVDKLKSDLLKSLESFKLPVLFFQKMEKEINDSIHELQRKINQIGEVETNFSSYSQFRIDIYYELFKVTPGGEVILPDESESKLKEIASVFVESEDQKKAIQMVTSINENLSSLQALLKQKNLPFLAGRGNRLKDGILQETEQGHFWIKPGAIKKLL
jgi:hypothetical protein